MSTLLVIVIVVVALIVIALLVSAARRSGQRRELGHAQAEAQHDDVRHHRERADESRTRPRSPRSERNGPRWRPS